LRIGYDREFQHKPICTKSISSFTVAVGATGVASAAFACGRSGLGEATAVTLAADTRMRFLAKQAVETHDFVCIC
jgi:hypothetical protein